MQIMTLCWMVFLILLTVCSAQLSAVLNAACVCLLYVCVRVRRRPYVSVRWRVRCHGNRHMAAITCSEEEGPSQRGGEVVFTLFNHQSVSIGTTMLIAWTFTTAGSRTSAAGPAVYYPEMSHDLLSSWKMNGLFTFSRPSHISQVQRFCRCSMTESKLQITGSSTNIGDQSLEARAVYFHPGQRWTDRVNQRTEAEVTN